jgi:hypothetical protein
MGIPSSEDITPISLMLELMVSLTGTRRRFPLPGASAGDSATSSIVFSDLRAEGDCNRAADMASGCGGKFSSSSSSSSIIIGMVDLAELEGCVDRILRALGVGSSSSISS